MNTNDKLTKEVVAPVHHCVLCTTWAKIALAGVAFAVVGAMATVTVDRFLVRPVLFAPTDRTLTGEDPGSIESARYERPLDSVLWRELADDCAGPSPWENDMRRVARDPDRYLEEPRELDRDRATRLLDHEKDMRHMPPRRIESWSRVETPDGRLLSASRSVECLDWPEDEPCPLNLRSRRSWAEEARIF